MSEMPHRQPDDTIDFDPIDIDAARQRLRKPAPVWSPEVLPAAAHEERAVATTGLHKAREVMVGIGDVSWSMIKAFFTGEAD
jgi:hypothetical protein